MLVKIHNVIGRGFLSFYQSFTFPISIFSGQTLQIDGLNKDDEKSQSNGSGKSSLLEAINWGLFGELCRKNRYKEEVISKGEKECEVIIDFEIDGITYRLERAQKRKKTQELSISTYVSANPTAKLWEGSTLSVKQQNLEKLIGMDFATFVCSVMFGRDFMSFPDLLPSDRANLLTKIMSLEKFTKCSQRASESLKVWKVEEQSLNLDLKGLEGELSSLRQISYKEKITQFEISREFNINSIESKISSLEEELKSLTNQDTTKILQFKEQIKKFKDQKNNLEKEIEDLPNQRKLKEKFQEEKQQIFYSKGNITNEIDKLKNEVKNMKTLEGGRCSRCKQKVSKEHLEKEISFLNTEIEDRIILSKQYFQQISKIQEQEQIIIQTISYLEKSDKLTQSIQSDIYKIEFSLLSLEESAEQKVLLKEIEQLEKSMKSEQEKINPFIKMEEERVIKAKQIAIDIQGIKRKIEESQRTQQIYAFWSDGFKKLRFRLFDLVKDHFESISQRILSEYTSELSIRFDTERETKTGTLKDEFHIVVTDINNQEISYEMYSGGERQKVRLSVAIALSEMISDQTNREFNFQAFDEPNDALDDVGKEINFETFFNLAQKGKAILVTDHDANFKDRFDHSIKIIKKDGKSKIEKL